MADDRKHGEVIAFKCTERMALDLLRLAADDDRSVSDYLYRLVRSHLYGSMVRLSERNGDAASGNDVNREK